MDAVDIDGEDIDLLVILTGLCKEENILLTREGQGFVIRPSPTEAVCPLIAELSPIGQD